MSNLQEPLALLALARMHVAGATGATDSQVRKDLGALLRHPGDVLRGRLERVLTELENRGMITVTRKGKTTRYHVADTGRAVVVEALHLPPAPKLTWSALRDGYVVPHALGLGTLGEEERKRIKSAGGLRGAILAHVHNLPLDGVPSLNQALDALLWKQIGRETSLAFTVSEVKAWLLNQMVDAPRPLPLKQLQAILPARAADAARNDAAGLRQAIIAGWAHPAACPAPAPAEPHPSPAPGMADVDLEQFSNRVKNAARTSPRGWFGDHKIFIGHAYRSFVSADAHENITLARFKDLLVEANHRGLLELARADLVEAMDRQDIRESETRYLHAVFHFLVLN